MIRKNVKHLACVTAHVLSPYMMVEYVGRRDWPSPMGGMKIQDLQKLSLK